MIVPMDDKPISIDGPVAQLRQKTVNEKIAK